MSRRFYPRQKQSRIGAIADHRFNGPRNDQSCIAGFSQDPVNPFNVAGVLSISPVTTDEISVSSSGLSFTMFIDHAEEKWAAVLGDDNDTTTNFLAGINSNGLALDHTMLTRNSDKLVTLAVPAIESFHIGNVGSSFMLSAGFPAASFQRRSSVESASVFGVIAPAGIVTTSAGLTFLESEIVAGGSVIDFFLDASDAFQSSPNSATIAALIAGMTFDVYDTVLTVAVFSYVAADNISVTLPADAGYTIAADAHIAWTVPRSMFLARKADFNVGTVAVVTNEA